MQLHSCFNLLVLDQVQQYTSQISSSSELIKLTKRIYSLLLYRITESAARKDTKRHLTHLGAQGHQLNINHYWQIFDHAIQKASINRGSFSSPSGNLVHCFPFPVVRKLFLTFNLNLFCQSLSPLLLVLSSVDIQIVYFIPLFSKLLHT